MRFLVNTLFARLPFDLLGGTVAAMFTCHHRYSNCNMPSTKSQARLHSMRNLVFDLGIVLWFSARVLTIGAEAKMYRKLDGPSSSRSTNKTSALSIHHKRQFNITIFPNPSTPLLPLCLRINSCSFSNRSAMFDRGIRALPTGIPIHRIPLSLKKSIIKKPK
jgi:hypothetical protein